MNKDRTTISVQVPPELKERLEKVARMTRWDKSGLIREMIERLLPAYEAAIEAVQKEE